MSELANLNNRFGLAGKLAFEEAGGLVAARVTTAFASATVALQGAHVMTWQPTGQAPVIWLSKFAKFAPGKSIRGGVPVCWPWFGPHGHNPQFPGHGFARTVPWALVAASLLPDDRVRLEFELVQSDATRAQWPSPSSVRNIITVGPELEVEIAKDVRVKMDRSAISAVVNPNPPAPGAANAAPQSPLGRLFGAKKK